MSGPVTINFAETAGDPAQRFQVKSVMTTGADPIGEFVDFAHLDLALLEVETINAVETRLPSSLDFVSDPLKLARSARLFTVGFPALPDVPAIDLQEVSRLEVVEQLRRIFGLRYGRKYLSPGLVSGGLDQDSRDPQAWVFDHDATTLGGNSGSAVFYFGDPMGVLGLHFAGDWMRANHAHGMAAVRTAAAGRIAALRSYTGCKPCRMGPRPRS